MFRVSVFIRARPWEVLHLLLVLVVSIDFLVFL